MPKGNPNPSPATRFKPGNSGRPREARDKITRYFLHALADHFEQHGEAAIQRVYEEDPAKYLSTVAQVIPKEIEITRPLDGMSDDQLTAAIQALTDAIKAQAPPPPPFKEDRPQLTVQ